MKDLKQKLMIEQMNAKLQKLFPLLDSSVPKNGWIHSIRVCFKMSLRQFGKRMKVTRQGAGAIEKRQCKRCVHQSS